MLRGETTGAGSLRTRVLSEWRFSLHGTARDLSFTENHGVCGVRELKPTVIKPRPSHQVSDAGLAPGHRTADSPRYALAQETTLPHAWFSNLSTSEELHPLGPDQRKEEFVSGFAL